MTNIEVIGLGALNIDHIYRVKRLLENDEVVVDEAQSFPGGSAANTIYGLAKLGIKTGFAGVVGNDAEGKLILRDFDKVGVNTSQISIKQGVKTGSVLCLSDGLGRRSLYIMPSANSLLAMDDLDLNYVNQAKILHVSSFASDRQFKVLLKLMDKLDPSVKVSFAPGALYAAKGLSILAPILAKTYALFINEKEIRQLTGRDFIAGAQNCLDNGCQIIVVTLGEGTELQTGKGPGHRTVTTVSYIRDAQSEYTVEPHSQSVVFDADTTGAGDAFAAGFIYGLLKGKGLEECGRLGDIIAQLCIGKMGARQGLPASTELAQRYQEFYSAHL